jgi:hypothetical protein
VRQARRMFIAHIMQRKPLYSLTRCKH